MATIPDRIPVAAGNVIMGRGGAGGQHSTFCAMLYGRRNFASAVLVHNQRNSEMLLGGLASPVKFLHKKRGGGGGSP